MADSRTEFIEAVFWHGSREKGDAILAAHPELAASDIHVAAMLGDDIAVHRFLAADPGSVRSTSGPRNLEPLVHLCFSVYLTDSSRTGAFLRTATALLDAGADINAGFHDGSHTPPTWESLTYGAAGVAHNAALTQLLLDRGADPNDGETAYHVVETDHNDVMKVLLDSGKMDAVNVNTMLLRETDWHDYEGVKMVLDHGADPNGIAIWGKTALHNAVLSNNDIAIVDLLLDRGADPTIVARRINRGGAPGITNQSSVALAARRGRGDALRSFRRHGFSLELTGVEKLLSACALDDGATIEEIKRREPQLVDEVLAGGGVYLAEFTASDNARGMAWLLDLGVPVDARYLGDGYFNIPPDSTALHVAAWFAWQGPLELLIARGADVEARDGNGNTPLRRAVDATLTSYWTGRRTPDGVRALLDAGARRDDVTVPTGYEAIDELLE
jgi:ankyrin repeat protein